MIHTITRMLFLFALVFSLTAQDLVQQDPEPNRFPSLIGVEYEGPVNLSPVVTSTKAKPVRNEAVYSVGDTPPDLANFYWVNQGACVANTNPDGSVTLFHPGAAGLGWNTCMIVTPLPAPPYTVISGFTGHILGKAASLAEVLLESSNGKYIMYSTGSSDTGVAALAAWRMNSPTLYQAPPVFSYSTAMATGGLLPQYYRTKRSGGFRTRAISNGRGVWLTISVTSDTDHVTGDYIGFASRGTGDNLASLMTIFHHSITTP